VRDVVSVSKKSKDTQVVIVDGQARVVKKITRQEAMERAEMYVARNLPKYLKKLHELAMGIALVKETKLGPKVYVEAPDRQALQYLIDRGLGKLPERVELTGEEGGPVEVLPWAPAALLREGNIINVEAKDVTGDEGSS